MGRIRARARRNAVHWLGQGISPRRLALTLALGFAVGCIPVVGVPTLLCSALAVALRLNLPAIQAANYAVMPLQLALILPFVRMGGWILSKMLSAISSAQPALVAAPHALPHLPAVSFTAHVSGLACQALLAWLLVAVPSVALMTATLTAMLRRIPVLSAAEAGD